MTKLPVVCECEKEKTLADCFRDIAIAYDKLQDSLDEYGDKHRNQEHS